MAVMIAAIVVCVLAVAVIIQEKIRMSDSNSQKNPNSAAVPFNAGDNGSNNAATSSTEPVTSAPN